MMNSSRQPTDAQLLTAYLTVIRPALHANMIGTRIMAWERLKAARGQTVNRARLARLAGRPDLHLITRGGAA